MPLIETLKTKLGVPGKRKYETSRKIPPFASMSLKEKLQSIVLNLRQVNREQRRRNNFVYYLMCLYYQGYQNIELAPSGNTFDIYEKDDFYVENQFRKHVDTVKQLLNKMEGDIVVRPASDSPKDIATSRVADQVIQSMLATIGYDKLRDQKNLYKCLMGASFQFNDYIVDKKYGTVVTPKFSYEERNMDGQSIMSKVQNGYDKRNKGQEVATACSPLEIHTLTDIKGGLESVPFLQWISRQDVDIVNYLYPGLNVGSAMSTQSEQDMATEYLEVLGNLAGNIIGDTAMSRGDNRDRKVELVRTWAEPCTFRGDPELEREFADGVHVTTVNGTVVDWYEECLTDRWTLEVLIPLPHALLGDGLYDAILMQDQLNEVNSLLIQHLRYSTVGHKFYDALVFDPKDVVNDPKHGFIPGKPAMDKTIAGAVVNLPPGQLSQDVPMWRASLLQSMQDMTSAYDPVTGKGLGANTPYSQSVFLAERAQSRWQGSLSYNRPELVHFHEQLLQLARDNWVDERTRGITDNTGKWSFQQFSQADLQGKVDIILSNTDFKPNSRAEQIQGLQMYGPLAAVIASLPPRQKLRVEEMMGFPPDANPINNQITRAVRHIDRIRKKEAVAPLPFVDDAKAQLPVFQDFLVSEEGEALAEQDPEAFANVYTYMTTLLMMSMSQMASPGGMMASQLMGGMSKGEPMPGPSMPAEKKQPGGQLGQQGGGEQQMAQTVEPQQPLPAIPAGQ